MVSIAANRKLYGDLGIKAHYVSILKIWRGLENESVHAASFKWLSTMQVLHAPVCVSLAFADN